MQIREALTLARQRLGLVSETAALDAQVVLAHLLGQSRAWVLAHPEAHLATDVSQAFSAALDRLAGGESLPYLLGHWEFFGLDFRVTPEVLIPRPETELLVETALEWLQRRWAPAAPGRPGQITAIRSMLPGTARHSGALGLPVSESARRLPFRLAADIGTGSGCIAVALAVHTPDLHLVAADLSWPALLVARQNVLRYGLDSRIQLVQADLLAPFAASGAQPFDLICANLPYIPTETLQDLPVAHQEPVLALHGGPDGLDWIRALLGAAPRRLAPGGLLLMEIEAGQGRAVSTLAHRAFPGAVLQILPDLSGHDRLLSVEMSRS